MYPVWEMPSDRLCGQPLSPLQPSPADDVFPAGGTHPLQKAVVSLPPPVTWLKGPLHLISPLCKLFDYPIFTRF